MTYLIRLLSFYMTYVKLYDLCQNVLYEIGQKLFEFSQNYMTSAKYMTCVTIGDH